MEDSKAVLGELLYAHIWPDIAFSRVLQLKRVAETVAGLALHPGRYSETRVQALNRGYGLQVELQKLVASGVVKEAELKVIYRVMNEETSLGISDKAFLPGLGLLASRSQQEKWLPQAKTHQFIGCWAFNELGNGSAPNSLETTAQFDQETREFELNSPSIASVKWLIGALGKTATHALVFARLKIREKDYGLQAFIVNIRDPVTLDPCAGVEIGDIGPKYGANYIDNGYLRLKKVRVPLERLLGKYAEVSARGEVRVEREGMEVALLRARIGLRTGLIAGCWYQLARAATIALRYSSVRLQFRTYAVDPTKERPVLDYQLQSYRLLPILAKTYALNAGSGLVLQLQRTMGEEGRVLLDCVTAGMKAVYSWNTGELLEVCRECCGGHGFSAYSGLPTAYKDFLATMALDGDNAGLVLQSAQLLTQLLQIPTIPAGPLSYLRTSTGTIKVEGSLGNPVAQTQALRGLVCLFTQDLALKVTALRRSGRSEKQVWSADCQLDCLRLVKVCIWELTHTALQDCITGLQGDSSKELLTAMGQLFAVQTLYLSRSDLMRKGLITTLQAEDLFKVLLEAVAEGKRLREPLIEAFCLSDAELNSALGVKSGEVYEKLLQWAMDYNPLNAVQPFEPVRHLKAKL